MSFPKNKPIKDKKYLRWISTQPCIIEGCNSPQDTVVPHHIETGGMGTKCSDYKSVSLCYPHHNESGEFSAHRLKKRFEGHHGVNLKDEAHVLLMKYEAMGGKIKLAIII